ncbi:MAG: TonB-dependent receptor [Deltaproteobacteria bacterium]|nr:TonB-dependent receptor [Deltaproteobacteria bacterium]
MLAPKFWQRKIALLMAALLLVVPASAQDPVDPDEDSAAAETDDPTDPTDVESDTKASDATDFGEPLMMDRDEMLFQGSDIEEILITGEKQNTLQDAPTSSTSFSASDLQALRIEDIADLADYTPNLEINTAFAASNPTIFIRGIGLKDYNANAAGAVAVYQDGVNINSPAIQLGQLFDIDGIDVMRGPQGSVNGRNATAGAIMIRSAMPDGEFGVSTSLTYGNYDNKEVEAAINIPLIEDMLSMRVSGTAAWRDGYTKNQCAGFDPTRHGFPDANQDPTTDLYNSLIPVGTYENGVLRPIHTTKENGRPISEDPDTYVFLDYDAAIEAMQIAGTIKPGPQRQPRILGEDIYDIDGNLVATQGTRVAGMATTFRVLETAVDSICYMKSPGILSTLRSENPLEGDDTPRSNLQDEGFWTPDPLQPASSTFNGLNRWTNNVENWAARMVLLFEPLDNMEWMLNAHGTQNRGDSAHLQMLGAKASFSGGFDEVRQGGFSENSAAQQARNNRPPIGEGWRDVKGLTDDPAKGPDDDPDDKLQTPGQGGGNPFSGFYDQDGTEYIDAWGINGKGFWDLGAVIITLLYDYEWYDRVVEDEGDASPLKIFPAVWSDSAWQTTEELRIEGEGERYKWTAGFFFLHEELTANNFFPDTQQFEINQDFSQKLTSWAPYVAGEIDLVEEDTIPGIYELTLAGGIRYNNEKKEFSLVSSAIGTTSEVKNVELEEETVEATWKEWTGDVKLSYTPFSNEYGSLLSYLSFGHGFKGGHFNAGLTVSGGDPEQDIDPVEPEFIDAIELGFRTRWFDDRVILNAAVFRYWYQDLQVFDITNEPGKLPIQKLLNADADVLGAEAELRLRPLPGLMINANLGWLDSEFKDFKVIKTISVPRNPNPQPVEFDYTGNNLVAAPTWNWSVVTEYEIPLFGWGSLVPQYDFNYRSKGYLDPQMIDPISQEGYWLHNARIAYRTPDERIELAFWVSNIFEEEYKVDVFDQSRQAESILEVWAEPRMYGVTLSLNW